MNSAPLSGRFVVNREGLASKELGSENVVQPYEYDTARRSEDEYCIPNSKLFECCSKNCDGNDCADDSNKY